MTRQANRPKQPPKRKPTRTTKKQSPVPNGMLTITKLQQLIDSVSDPTSAFKRQAEMIVETYDWSGKDDGETIKFAQTMRKLIRGQAVPNQEDSTLYFQLEGMLLGTVETMAEEMLRTDPEIQRIDRAVKKLEKEKYKLSDDEYFENDDMPEDLERLHDQWLHRFHALEADILRQHGEDELANIYQNPAAYEKFHDGRMRQIEAILTKKDSPDLTEVA